MLTRFVTRLYMLAGVALATVPLTTAAASINLLSSTNATWTADVGKSTCTISPRASGDSLVATWSMDSGGWSDTWISLVATVSASLSGADSIKILYKNNNADGFSLRLTLKDNTMWESLAYLNGLSGLQAVNFALNATTFPQFKFASTDPTGVFSVNNIKSISFVNNTNPTLLTKTTHATGVYTIYSVNVTLGGASVRPAAGAASMITGGVRISPPGFTAPEAGDYTIFVYGANGAILHRSKAHYTAGFNKIDFSKRGSGVCIVKVSGNGYAASGRLVIR